MATDGSTPMALDYFAAMGGDRVHSPDRVVFALDHYAPAPSRHTTQLHARMRTFAADHGIELWDVGEGIGHQLMVERGRAVPGGLAVGADSHSVTYGALNTFATGIGSSDLAAILMCGDDVAARTGDDPRDPDGRLEPGGLCEGCRARVSAAAWRGRRSLSGARIRGRRPARPHARRPPRTRQHVGRDGREERDLSGRSRYVRISRFFEITRQWKPALALRMRARLRST